MGVGITQAVHFGGDTEMYEAKIVLLASYDMHWAYLSCFVFSALVNVLNYYALPAKEAAIGTAGGGLNTNQ